MVSVPLSSALQSDFLDSGGHFLSPNLSLFSPEATFSTPEALALIENNLCAERPISNEKRACGNLPGVCSRFVGKQEVIHCGLIFYLPYLQ